MMELADEWCKKVQNKMERFNNPTEGMLMGEGQDYISFEMLEDQNNDQDIIRVGERVLEDLDKQIQPPIPQLQNKLDNLTVQFDEHFNNKLEMICHTPNLMNEEVKQVEQPPISPPESIANSNIVSKEENHHSVPIIGTKENNLLEDDDDLLTSFDIPSKMEGEDNLVSNQNEETPSFLKDVEDPAIEPGNTDAAYDKISFALEN